MTTIALAMIARDEARCIARSLASVRPFVDRIVVIDTGSTDKTRELARAAGAEVHHFSWIDDFAAARNRALEIADGDWNLVLDADEWLADGGAALAGLRELAPTFAGQLRVDSEFDAADGVSVAPSWLARMLPRGARFFGRIHEQAEPALERRRLPVHIGHDGYRAVRQTAKRGRNQRLLRIALAEQPKDPYLHYQLGKDLELADRFDEALSHYDVAYAHGSMADAWRHDLVLRLVFTLKMRRRWQRAIALADAERPRWPDSPDYFFAVGDLLLDWAAAEPKRAPELLPMIESSWQQCLAIGEQPDREGAVLGRGSFLAAKNLAAFHTSLGHVDQAAHYARLEASLSPSLAS